MAVSILAFLDRSGRQAVEEVLRHSLALRLTPLINEELGESHETLKGVVDLLELLLSLRSLYVSGDLLSAHARESHWTE